MSIKLKLDIVPSYDFILLGISSHEHIYRLSWSLNNELNFKLSQKENLTNMLAKENLLQEFSLFQDESEERCISLISNYSENGYLVKKLKNVDFFLKVESEFSNDIEDLVGKLKKIAIISVVFPLDLKDIKNKQIFIF